MSYSFDPSPATGIMHESLEVAPSKYPTRDDWERHRPLIKQLYVDEGRKLKEVMTIMAQHGHNATPKMYKDRIRKWGLEKKNKERDMVAILRKKTEREAVGKATLFRVRGQAVTMEDVLHYFKRKKGTREMGISAASTPSDICCWTPSPARTPQPVDDDNQMISTDFGSSEAYFDTSLPLAPANNDSETGMVGRGWAPAPPFVGEHIVQLSLNDIHNLLSDRSRIPRSPSLPQTLLVLEHLLFSIKKYFGGSFDSGTWITDKNGYCTTTTLTNDSVYGHLGDFGTYFLMADDFARKGLWTEFRRILSKAFNLVQLLLRVEHPKTLGLFLDVFLTLTRNGLSDVVSLLRNYVNKMATNIIAEEHPWGHICRLIGMLDADSLEQAVIQCWEYSTHALEKGFGQFNISALNARLQFIRRVYGSTNLLDEDRLLRGLLAQLEQDSRMLIRPANLIMLKLVFNLIQQGHFREAEEMGLDVLSQSQIYRFDINRISALELTAWSQYHQHKTNLAEKNLRAAIGQVIDRGEMVPLAIILINSLETWLRQWGREEEADKWRAETDELIGKDEIDEEIIGE